MHKKFKVGDSVEVGRRIGVVTRQSKNYPFVFVKFTEGVKGNKLKRPSIITVHISNVIKNTPKARLKKRLKAIDRLMAEKEILDREIACIINSSNELF